MVEGALGTSTRPTLMACVVSLSVGPWESMYNFTRSGGKPISEPIRSMVIVRAGEGGIIAAKQSTASRKMSSHVSRAIVSFVKEEQWNAVRFAHFRRSRGERGRLDLREVGEARRAI